MHEIYAVNYTSEREGMRESAAWIPADLTHSQNSNLTFTSSLW